MKKIIWGVILTILICILPTVYSAKSEDGFKVKRSGFKEIKKDKEENPNNTLVKMKEFMNTSKGSGNSTGGEVTGVESRQKKTNEDGSDLNIDIKGYDGSNYTPVKRDKFKAGQVNKGTQAEIVELIKFAKSKAGNNYYWKHENVDYPFDPLTYSPGHEAKDGVDGADCSGYVKTCFEHIGVYFDERNSSAYCNLGKKIDQKDMKPGDIVMFTGSKNKNESVCHTAIYIGNKKIMQSSGGPKQPGQIKESQLNGEPGNYHLGNVNGSYAQAVHTVVRLLEID